MDLYFCLVMGQGDRHTQLGYNGGIVGTLPGRQEKVSTIMHTGSGVGLTYDVVTNGEIGTYFGRGLLLGISLPL